jgi:hypothetical protein
VIREIRTTILVAATNNSLATIYTTLSCIFHISYILRLVFALDPSFDCIRQEASNKQQATSNKQQATSNKQQATSNTQIERLLI